MFFNIPEEKQENCFKKINKILQDSGIQAANTPVLLDRAHRLGKFKIDSLRPRPIIVAFTYFVDKEYVLRNGFKLKATNVNLSEDYSRSTINIHKELVEYAKRAKDAKDINNFQIKYRRVNVQHIVGNSEKFLYQSYDLKFIKEHPNNWFSLKPGTSSQFKFVKQV